MNTIKHYRGISRQMLSDVELQSIPLGAACLLERLPLVSDDWGFVTDSPAQITTDVFGARADVPVECYLDLLVAVRRIQRLAAPVVRLDELGADEAVPAKRVLWIRHFPRDQMISNPEPPSVGEPQVLAALRTVYDKRRRHSIIDAVVEAQPFANYVALPVPDERQRRVIQRRVGAAPGRVIEVECLDCGAPGEVRHFVPPRRHGEWAGTTVSSFVEIVPHESFDDGVALLCRTCRSERFALYGVRRNAEGRTFFGDLDVSGTDVSGMGDGALEQALSGGVDHDRPSAPEDTSANDGDGALADVVPIKPTPSPRPRSHQPDRLFEAVCEVCGIDWEHELTASMRGPVNKAVKNVREVGATPEEVRVRAERYKDKFEHAALTPSALAKNWALLAEPVANRRRAAGQNVGDWRGKGTGRVEL